MVQTDLLKLKRPSFQKKRRYTFQEQNGNLQRLKGESFSSTGFLISKAILRYLLSKETMKVSVTHSLRVLKVTFKSIFLC